MEIKNRFSYLVLLKMKMIEINAPQVRIVKGVNRGKSIWKEGLLRYESWINYYTLRFKKTSH
ncbi:hypothetical protein BCY86_03650 [Pajaroellobacter abortibovis]|uniref:Uncharacterized protein n=1 Tax=Pajaroellobacter abortibovis TaxID=1882918 RepID=A0A1L6MWF5_9BACT|nr:hypothetical protein BCY86_03650 [Pajaroellobacter abortibovis]